MTGTHSQDGMSRPEPSDDFLFLREEPPDDVVLTHIVYLHHNWELILKPASYVFSPRCHVSEGGFVRHAWSPYTSATKIIKEASAMGSPRELLIEFAERVGLV
jgi:hypothetical protein